jgi:hypothetical protein
MAGGGSKWSWLSAQQSVGAEEMGQNYTKFSETEFSAGNPAEKCVGVESRK